VRVTGGFYRGRKVLCPPGDIRPSMDRMRISLFSILGNLSGLSFLDLFSGSGVIGIEAASRGAEPVVLVEKDPRKKATILKNISFVEEQIKLVTAPVERFLRSDTGCFDLVFLDPPFAFKDKDRLLGAVFDGPHLSRGGLAILHVHRAEKIGMERPGAALSDRREYGQSTLLFFRRREGEDAPSP
jgi:16S rRNA (guanine966-N2)-methyltransferase